MNIYIIHNVELDFKPDANFQTWGLNNTEDVIRNEYIVEEV